MVLVSSGVEVGDGVGEAKTGEGTKYGDEREADGGEREDERRGGQEGVGFDILRREDCNESIDSDGDSNGVDKDRFDGDAADSHGDDNAAASGGNQKKIIGSILPLSQASILTNYNPHPVGKKSVQSLLHPSTTSTTKSLYQDILSTRQALDKLSRQSFPSNPQHPSTHSYSSHSTNGVTSSSSYNDSNPPYLPLPSLSHHHTSRSTSRVSALHAIADGNFFHSLVNGQGTVKSSERDTTTLNTHHNYDDMGGGSNNNMIGNTYSGTHYLQNYQDRDTYHDRNLDSYHDSHHHIHHDSHHERHHDRYRDRHGDFIPDPVASIYRPLSIPTAKSFYSSKSPYGLLGVSKVSKSNHNNHGEYKMSYYSHLKPTKSVL